LDEATRLTWDEVLGEVPMWLMRHHLPDRKSLTIEMVQLQRCKIELFNILGTMKAKRDGSDDDC
jgi:hypothetical protein